ncbi:helix-turn-helix domain-containing protein [Microbispora sp. ATCC PTA-5024]|uniref:helix-turn-helix domain-containing protein n=1 Tax=Microbispora sp. ATCC PTA-5024 TaxID=316330 RepID=UPI0003DCFD02|nr:helix-turn-helix transcriptional regulator [Microbispora sp. ATCC PTA-5024]ETK34940.1 XRE family transcriptional regulator [Microbispora sp. ATCC PTA-5024]
MTAASTEGAPHPRNLTALPDRSPTVLRILLGTQLRRLREGRHIKLEEAGRAIRASHSKISRMELGRVGFRLRDVSDLLTLYGVTDETERESMLSLVARANAPGWWHNYDDVLPSWFEAYVGLEQAATSIRNYEVQFVPGLLQTEDYAKAVVRLGHPTAGEEEIARRVRLRMDRQAVLTRPDPPHLWAVIDEAVIRRPLGGPDVMRAQMERLLDLVTLPNVTLQIVPFSVGGHAAAGGPYSILRFAELDVPDVVYLEQLTSAIYLDKREETDRYLAVMERLCLEANPVADTKRMLQRVMTEL